MIIGINGKIGSGKDTVGKIIQYLVANKNLPKNMQYCSLEELDNGNEFYSNWEVKKFAGKLKTIASLLTGIPVEKFEDQEFKKQEMSEEWWYKNIYDAGWDKKWTKETINYPTHTSTESHIVKTTYRQFLQNLGTEAMRDGLHSNVWVNALFSDYVDTRTDKVNGYSTYTWKAEYKDGKFYVPYHAAVPSEHHGKEVNHPEFSWTVERKEKEYPNWIITDLRFPNEMEAVKERQGITIRVVRPVKETAYEKAYRETHLHPSEKALDDAEFDYEIINDGTIADLVEKVREILVNEKLL